MAIVQLHGGAHDPRLQQMLAARLIGESLGGLAQNLQAHRQQRALGELLAGKAGP